MAKFLKLVFLVIAALVVALGFLTLSPMLLAQNVNVRYDNVVWTVAYISGQQTYVPVPGAQVQICAYPANAVPCTNLATLFVGPTVLGGTSTNPVQADQFGNFGFWAAAGYYSYTVTNPLGQSAGPYPLTLGGSGGSGGTFALFPATQGIVFNTSTTSATTATSAQIVAALNNSPSTQLSPALIPPASGIIPATTNLLKGSGVAGSAAAATPGTDYLIPGALPNGTTATTQSPGDSSTKLATDAFVLANTTGAPGGSNNQLQINVAGAFGADPTLSFDFPSHTLLMLNENLAANGIATQANNQNSGTLVMEADVCTVSGITCTPAGVFYGQQIFASTGPNPLTLMNYNCTSTSTGTCGANFNYPIFDSNNFPVGDKTTALATNLSVYNNLPALPAQYFGAFGDAYQPPNGCSTTASSTTVSCPDGPFVSTDVGKQIWVSGAGASGHAFNATITTFTSNTDVVVSAAATGTVTNGRGIIGHDDTTAVNACFQYSASNAVQCVLKAIPTIGDGLTGFLIGTGPLLLAKNNFLEESSATNVIGSGQSSSTNLFCEFNGDCLSLVAGPIQGANVTNLSFDMDPTQPASRGLHFKPQAGTFGVGPFTNSNITNVQVNNPALECLWLDGGGGPGYAFNLPNQYLNFTQFFCSGPNQSHPANLIKMTGQAAQIIFINGQTNGQGWNGVSASLYPNPQVSITELTSTLGDTPVDVKFYGFTIEVGTQGLFIGNGTNNIHYDNGYIENVSSPFIVAGGAAGASANTLNGNHIANSGNIGAVWQFTNTSSATPAGASIRDSQVYGGVAPPIAVATCSGRTQVDYDAPSNYIASGVSTNSCLPGVTVAAASSPLTANTCTSPATKTIVGLTPLSVISSGYSADPTSLTGWGSAGGMVFHAWPSANDTLSWNVCNQSGSSITYSAITFNVVYK